MAKMLEGIEANGLFSMVDAVVTGHFSQAEQVAVAAGAIARIRRAPRRQEHRHSPPQPIVIVDPIMGDDGPGLYVKPPVAEALVRDLIPLADIVAPNLWEFARLKGVDPSALRAAEDVAALAQGGQWLISSVPSPQGIGVLHVDGAEARLAETPHVSGKVPNGTGDMLTLRFAGGLVSGFGAERRAGGCDGRDAPRHLEDDGMGAGRSCPWPPAVICSARQHSAPVRKIS